MLPIRWDPVRDLNTLHREFDDLMRRAFGGMRQTGEGKLAVTPAINTFIKDGLFHLQAELPGVDIDKLDVRLDGNDLVLRGEREVHKKVDEADYLIQESRFASFERRMSLPQGVDIEQVHATYKDGLLEVTMPITAKEIVGRKIQIEGLKTAKKSKEVH